MTMLLALLAAQAVAAPAPIPVPAEPPVAAPVAITPPGDWSAVPPLPWRSEPRLSADLVAYVQRTAAAERCPVTGTRMSVDVAVFVRGDGLPRATVPRAIDCPAVEQFAAGLVSSLARNNLRLPASGWYRTTVSFDWTR